MSHHKTRFHLHGILGWKLEGDVTYPWHMLFFSTFKKNICVCVQTSASFCASTPCWIKMTSLSTVWFVRWYNVWMNTLSCWKFWTKSMKPDRFAATHLMVSRNHAHVKLYSGWESLAQVHTFPSKWHTVKLCLTNTLHKMYQLSIIELTWANFPLFGYWIFFAFSSVKANKWPTLV